MSLSHCGTLFHLPSIAFLLSIHTRLPPGRAMYFIGIYRSMKSQDRENETAPRSRSGEHKGPGLASLNLEPLCRRPSAKRGVSVSEIMTQQANAVESYAAQLGDGLDGLVVRAILSLLVADDEWSLGTDTVADEEMLVVAGEGVPDHVSALDRDPNIGASVVATYDDEDSGTTYSYLVAETVADVVEEEAYDE